VQRKGKRRRRNFILFALNFTLLLTNITFNYLFYENDSNNSNARYVFGQQQRIASMENQTSIQQQNSNNSFNNILARKPISNIVKDYKIIAIFQSEKLGP
jgi:hypothetical protein